MKSYNKTFLVGLLALASMVLGVAHREAKAANPADSIQSYNMETTSEDREKARQNLNHLFVTLKDINTGDTLGNIDYDYTAMANGSSDVILLKICLEGEPCRYLMAHGDKCLTSFAPYSINFTKNKTPIPLLQNLFSDVFDIVENLEDPASKTGKSGRCIMEYVPVDGAPLIQVRGADLPANIIKGSIFQIGPTDLMTDLYSRG